MFAERHHDLGISAKWCAPKLSLLSGTIASIPQSGFFVLLAPTFASFAVKSFLPNSQLPLTDLSRNVILYAFHWQSPPRRAPSENRRFRKDQV